MLKRTLMLAAAGVLALAVPAGAQTYGEEPPSATASDTTPAPGETVTITGEGFAPGSNVNFTDGDDFNASDTADDAGVASVQFTMGNEPTTITISGVGPEGEAVVLNVTLTPEAAAAAPTGAGALPRTGEDSFDLGRVGIFLLAAGGATVYAVRRRQHATAGA